MKCACSSGGWPFKLEYRTLNFSDGLVAAKSENKKYTLTTPNMTFVPTPPWGRMSVRMKANAKFGTEDPLQWPQVHVPDEDYCFLACIPRPSHPSRRSELWMPLTTEDFVKHIATTSDRPLYVMAPQRVPALKKVLQELRAEVQLYEQQYGPSAELTKFYSRTEAAYERLRLPVVSWRDLRCQYVAVERCYCMTIAWITWHTQLKKISDEEAPLDVLKHLMGCFTKDSKVVEKLYKAGIPVWYMRRIDTLTKEDHIHQYVSLQSPRGMVLQEGDYNGHPANHVGNPGQKQLEAICYKSDEYMDGSPSPETTLPRGVASSSSSTHVPRTALADTTVSLNPNDLHDQFRDCSQEFMPSCIPVWQHALDTIWQNLGPIPSYSVWKYDLPRAADIIGLDGSDVDVRERRILNWLKLRNLWRSVLERNVTESTQELERELAHWHAYPDELGRRATEAFAHLNDVQKDIFTTVVNAVTSSTPLCLFIDGKAGRGKTYVINAICDRLRSLGHLVMPTATSGFAAQLYAGGRTTHSAFKVPVNDHSELLLSSIQQHSARADLIQHTSLITWDEAPMANRAVLACVDDTCRRILQNDMPFGGKVIVLLGDFRQTCPVIPHASRAEVVDASIKSSPLWRHFHIKRLTVSIRNAADPSYADFVDSIGDGAGPQVQLLDFIPSVSTQQQLIDFVFPTTVLTDHNQCAQRSILAPTHEQVNQYNTAILRRVIGIVREYIAADSLKEVEEAGLPSPDGILDYESRTTHPGLPPHFLSVKTNAIYRLLRNFSIDRSLVKNARVVVTDVGNRLVTVRILSSQPHALHADNISDPDILLPRISFTHALRSRHTLLRRQFPLAPAYATTFNSCQGLTLARVGIDLTRPVFSHGQLYTALSRVRQRSDARVMLIPSQTTALNVTYNEILL